MKNILLVLVFMVYNVKAQQPSLQFAKHIGNLNNGFASGKTIKVDKSSNIYSLGRFEGINDFDPSVSGTYTMDGSNGNLYLSKLDANGNYIWAKQFQTNTNQYNGIDYDLAIDSIGNSFITGVFFGPVDLDPGPSSLTVSNTSGSFVSKLDNNGNFVWGKVLAGSGNCVTKSIALDTSGNILLTGNFSLETDFDPGIATYTLDAGNTNNPFFLKLDPSGNFMWAKQINGSGNSSFSGFAITTDKLNNIYLGGGFQCVADFDASPSTYTLDATDNYREFVCKYSDSGNFIWAKHFGDGYFVNGGAINGMANTIRVDKNGNVYTAGNFYGKVDFDPGPFIQQLGCNGCYGLFVSKLNNSGDFIWTKEFLNPTYNSSMNAIELDNNSNVYTIGEFHTNISFNSLNSFTSFGQTDAFIAKLDQNGSINWAIQIGDTSIDKGFGVFVDKLNYVYTTGRYAYNADFDPGNGVLNLSSIKPNSF